MLAILAWCPRAFADPGWISPLETTHVQFDLDYWRSAAPGSGHDLADMDLQAQLDVQRHLAVTLDVPVTTTHVDGTAVYSGAYGNVLVGLQGFGHLGSTILLWGSLTGGVPTSYPDAPVYEPAPLPGFLVAAGVLPASYDRERYSPGDGSLRNAFGLEVGIPWFRYRFETAQLVLIDSFERPTSASTEVDIESYSEAECRLPLGFLVGGRLQWFMPFSNSGISQLVNGLAGGFYAGYHPAKGPFATAGVLLTQPEFTPAMGWVFQLRTGWGF